MVKSPLKARRLASSIMGCGLNKVWADPTRLASIKTCKTREAVRDLIQQGVVICKQSVGTSRARTNARAAAKLLARRSGPGKKRGTRNARCPEKYLWMTRIRVLRRLLKRCRRLGKIDKILYHKLYANAKGNQYKNKRVLLEAIIGAKLARMEEERLAQEVALRKEKAAALRAKRDAKTAALAQA